MKIDAHQHFWNYTAENYLWINDDMPGLKRSFLPQDLKPLLSKNGIDGCVAVQARHSEEETLFLLEMANQNDFVKGVVGWVDLRAENVRQRLETLTQDSYLKGIRHIVQDEPDLHFMLDPAFQRGIAALSDFELTYDILIYPRHLDIASHLIRSFPGQPFVIDHLAKPYIKTRSIEDWQRSISKLAYFDNVFCKISGLVTEADWTDFKDEDLFPYIDVVVKAFGPKRLMFGSDWPVCLLAADYDRVFNIVNSYFEEFTDDEKNAIFGQTAAAFYGLK